MKNKIPFMHLILVAGVIATMVAGAVIYQLYSIKLDAQKDELQKLVRDQAELFDYLTENGSEDVKSMLNEFVSDDSILHQNNNPSEFNILQEQLLLRAYGESGRILAAKIINGQIYYFHIRVNNSIPLPKPAPLVSDNVSPIRSALKGRAEVAQATRLNGDAILAASHPVESLSIAIVTGVDLNEIRAPYIRYGIVTLLVALAALIGSWLIYRKFGAAHIEHLTRDVIAHKEDAKTSRDELFDAKTKHAKTEAKLEESENKYKSIFESSENTMWLMLDGKFIRCNGAAVKTFRANALEDLLHVHPSHFSPLQQPDGTNSYLRAEEMMAEAIDKGYSRFFWAHKRLDGEEFPAEVTLTRINVDGHVGLHAMVRDITEEKIVEENLQKALIEAERANVAKSEFLASMSHEFRTPLNAILGFSEMLKAQYLGPLGADKYGEYVGDIYTSGTHLLDLINDILDISAIEAGQNAADKSFFDLDELIDQCIATVEPTAEDGKIEIIKNTPSGTPEIYAHRRGIKQILINVVANGIKYNHAGGKVWVNIDLKGDHLYITVEDNGIGIEDEFLPRILEPFSRADENSHMAQEGTGLGLSICQKLIEAYGGNLNIESTYGIGTKVTMMLPVETGDQLRDTG